MTVQAVIAADEDQVALELPVCHRALLQCGPAKQLAARGVTLAADLSAAIEDLEHKTTTTAHNALVSQTGFEEASTTGVLISELER
eukprot:CAMPEP_0172764268 /NCGR_PEP_ID=MMETSP1074-20121228/176928_1 /TAXON_ID=2916 /ORGANISM="Ceratium fusus, Strain PA161109" /LENGTH=85 /DNA_ID=CAMNT_0013599001 /DNA_START=142 /DNA_END=397 /DNA_ORIENTATION=-